MNKAKFLQTRSELHTHLMGMLSSEEFLKLIAKYSDVMYWPIDKAKDENSITVATKFLFQSRDALNAISVPLGEQKPYEETLNTLYRNRVEVLSYAILNYALRNHIDEIEARKIVYNDYFNRSMRELVGNGVKYTEISFANEEVIRDLRLDSDLKPIINYSFLLCTQRTNKIGNNVQERIQRAYDNGVAIGFDIMGVEKPLDKDELKDTGRKSYYKKINALLEVLTKHSDYVFRIHSGEAKGTEENSEKLFRIIDRIKKERGYKDFPPPELRLGHAVHYKKTNYYYQFLRDNHAIIEVNAISNSALSNIDSFEDLPYIDYLEHGIPIVISTDGHGAYNTSTLLEDKVAYFTFLKEQVPELYDVIVRWEKQYLEKKVNL